MDEENQPDHNPYPSPPATPWDSIAALPEPKPGRPLRILGSSCLLGNPVGYDGTDYQAPADYPLAHQILTHPKVQLTAYCPEDFALGSPRPLVNLHGGNGRDVLAGRAQVLCEAGRNYTPFLVAAAHRMLELAQRHQVDLALLMDMSAACGTVVISDGHRQVADRRYQQGPGLCAALLQQHGVPTIAQRDYKSLGLLLAKLNGLPYTPGPLCDHHETDWYRRYFGAPH